MKLKWALFGISLIMLIVTAPLSFGLLYYGVWACHFGGITYDGTVTHWGDAISFSFAVMIGTIIQILPASLVSLAHASCIQRRRFKSAYAIYAIACMAAYGTTDYTASFVCGALAGLAASILTVKISRI